MGLVVLGWLQSLCPEHWTPECMNVVHLKSIRAVYDETNTNRLDCVAHNNPRVDSRQQKF